jgi:GNAT superfamily N-acetyltransferase
MTIRDLAPERDADAIATIIREVWPTSLATPASTAHELGSLPERAHPGGWIAEVDGVVVAWASAFLNFFGGNAANVSVSVSGAYRSRGIGSALYAAALDHALSLNPPELLTTFYETPEGVGFAEARGFRETRAEQLSVLDPHAVDEQPAAEVRALTQANLRDAHRIDETTSRDIPAHEPITEIPYEEWEQWVLGGPTFQQEGSFIAYTDDGEPAALSLLTADLESGRAMNMYTGTLREFRGRGLGLAAKLASIHWAAEHGVAQMFTTNDERNAPMLAINRRLGYVPAGRRVEFSRAT